MHSLLERVHLLVQAVLLKRVGPAEPQHSLTFTEKEIREILQCDKGRQYQVLSGWGSSGFTASTRGRGRGARCDPEEHGRLRASAV